MVKKGEHVENTKFDYSSISVKSEWPVFSDVALNCETHGEKRKTCRKYKISIGSQVCFFLFILDRLFFTRSESEGRFVNLFGDFSPL